jgi:hypothetical protein
MATRRIHGDPVDHGAQYFTVKDRIFNGWVEAWENEGILKEWFSRLEEESSQLGHTRYCCREGNDPTAQAPGPGSGRAPRNQSEENPLQRRALVCEPPKMGNSLTRNT